MKTQTKMKHREEEDECLRESVIKKGMRIYCISVGIYIIHTCIYIHKYI